MRYALVVCGQTVTTKEVRASCVEFVLSNEEAAVLPKNTKLQFKETVYYRTDRGVRTIRALRKATVVHGDKPSDYAVEFEDGRRLPVSRLLPRQEVEVVYVPEAPGTRRCRILAQMEQDGIDIISKV